jgi:hypothetical protein
MVDRLPHGILARRSHRVGCREARGDEAAHENATEAAHPQLGHGNSVLAHAVDQSIREQLNLAAPRLGPAAGLRDRGERLDQPSVLLADAAERARPDVILALDILGAPFVA